jgi:hypothetical protein
VSPSNLVFFFLFCFHVAWSQNELSIENGELIFNNVELQIAETKVYLHHVTKVTEINKTPIQGTWKIINGKGVFTAPLPLTFTNDYTVVFKDKYYYLNGRTPTSAHDFYVETIYPQGDTLPENILKFHIKFSKKISPVDVYKHLHFIDHTGTEMTKVILDMQTPIIDETGTVLSFWVDPGRQKRGLLLNELYGVPFKIYNTYTLMVDDQIKNTENQPIQSKYAKTFAIGKPIRKRIDENTDIAVKKTKDTIVIKTNQEMDYKTVKHYIQLLNEGKNEIPSEIAFFKNEIKIIPTPNQGLSAPYFLAINPLLEDVCGNNFKYAFDREIDATEKTHRNNGMILLKI